jgi:hypothetical protein
MDLFRYGVRFGTQGQTLLVEMRGDDGKHYIIRGTVTVKMSPNESIAGHKG